MTDIANAPDGDIELGAGDITYSESTGQHQQDIILADKGYYKETPEIGVGAINFVSDNNPENFMRTIRKEFSRDGMKVKKIGVANGKIKTEAVYENDHSKI